MKRVSAAIALAIISFGIKGAAAQTYIGGEPVYCNDFRGIPVMTILNDGIPDVGRAYVNPYNGQPIIELNPYVLGQRSSEMQLFWYGHECAHHVLGHAFNPQLSNESEADCWSVATGRHQGWFPSEAFEELTWHLGNSSGSVWGHLPGPARIENMWGCYSN